MTLHRLKVKDLDTQFIQKLKSSHANEDAEITFWLEEEVSDTLFEELEDEYNEEYYQKNGNYPLGNRELKRRK